MPSWLGLRVPPAPDPHERGLVTKCVLSPPLLPVLLSQATGPSAASTGKRWEQTSELQQGVYWSRNVYCIQNLADPLFLQICPVGIGFASPFGEGEAVHPSSPGTALLSLVQCRCMVRSGTSFQERPPATAALGLAWHLASPHVVLTWILSSPAAWVGTHKLSAFWHVSSCTAGVARLRPLEHLRWVQERKPSLLPVGPALRACCWSHS